MDGSLMKGLEPRPASLNHDLWIFRAGTQSQVGKYTELSLMMQCKVEQNNLYGFKTDDVTLESLASPLYFN